MVNVAKEIQQKLNNLAEKIKNDDIDFNNLKPKEAYLYLINNYAEYNCLLQQQNFIIDHKSWNIPAIEEEISKLEDFISGAFNHIISDKQAFDDVYFLQLGAEYEIYKKIRRGFYNENKIPFDYTFLMCPEAQIYGRYELFYQFLINKRRFIYKSGVFSMLDQTTQIDEILTILCENPRDTGIQIEDLKRCILRKNYIITGQILREILHNLIEDGYLREKKDGFPNGFIFYPVTFKGRFFNSKGGYRNQMLEKTLVERRVQISQTLTWILAVGVTTPFLWYLLDILRNWYSPLFLPFRNYVLPCGIALFLLWLLYTNLKKYLHKMNRNK